MVEHLPIILVIFRGIFFAGALAYLFFGHEKERTPWRAVLVVLILGFGTNFANVFLAHYGVETFDTDFGFWDLAATGSFQFVFLAGMVRTKLLPPWIGVLVIAGAVVLSVVQGVVDADNQVVLRALWHWGSLVLMAYGSLMVSKKGYGLQGLIIAGVAIILLLIWGLDWHLMSNNILSR